MKNYLLTGAATIAVFMLSFMATAQSSRTIEVTVSENVFLKTTKITYNLLLDTTVGMWDEYGIESEYMEEDYEYEEYNYESEPETSEKKNKKKNKKENIETPEKTLSPEVSDREIESIEEVYVAPVYLSKTDLMKMLDSCKFNFYLFDHSNYSIGMEPGPITFTLILKNEEELKRVQQAFSGRTELTGSVKSIEYEAVESKMAVVYNDLYAKAEKEALSLAKISGLTLDKVQKIYEHRGELDTYMKSYQTILDQMNIGQKEPMDFNGKEVVVERSFVFNVK